MIQDPPELFPCIPEGVFHPALEKLVEEFYFTYIHAARNGCSLERAHEQFNMLIKLVIEQVKNPYPFEIYHESIRYPFDYYQFGLDFIRPLINFPSSRILGLRNIQNVVQQLKEGENVILLSNHQTEPDPQIISLLLEEINPVLAHEMIFVAGHRVVTDPIAIPLSIGRNLLCIYSKKHIAYPPEQKAEKILHNQRTMKKMGELLSEGGHCIYVAPSGGRDRQNGNHEVEISPFDPQSLELFWLMAQKSRKTTHFYPLSLKTYDLMPPPRHIEKEVGEKRIASFTPVYMAVGDEIDMNHFPGSEAADKKTKRDKRAEYVWNIVCKNYYLFPSSN